MPRVVVHTGLCIVFVPGRGGVGPLLFLGESNRTFFENSGAMGTLDKGEGRG